MDLATLQVKIIDYALEEIIPYMPGLPLNLFGINLSLSPEFIRMGAGVGVAMSTLNLERYAPMLQAVGIIDESGMIDAQKLSASLTEQIDKVGKFKIGDFEFDKNDVAKFIEHLNR